MTPAGVQISTATDTNIVLTRKFNAPRQLVWESMLTPDRMRRWMLPPPGWTTTDCYVDLRVGGALKIAWKNQEADPFMTLEGVFTEVKPYERAVHTEKMTLASGQVIGSQIETHEYSEKDGITTMRITQVFESKEARDGALESGAEGMECGYQRLDDLLASLA